MLIVFVDFELVRVLGVFCWCLLLVVLFGRSLGLGLAGSSVGESYEIERGIR